MSPSTQRHIAQDVRLVRGLLTAHWDWMRANVPADAQRECFRRIAFWRLVLRDAELRLAFAGEDDSEVNASVDREFGAVSHT